MDLIPREEVSSINKKAIFIGAGVLIVVALAAFFIFRPSEIPSDSGAVANPGETSGTTTAPVVDKYAPEKVDADTKVPGQGENIGNGVAAPTIVTEAAPGVEAKLRSFDLIVSGDKFIPDTVTVRIGDTANIFITAQDKNYDFTLPSYGLSSVLTKGVKKTILFQALTDGKYEFFCQSCGGPEKGPVGYVVVVPKE